MRTNKLCFGNVDVLSAAIMADGITSDNNYFCTGDSAVLEVYGGTIVAGSDWTWYENSCGGTTYRHRSNNHRLSSQQIQPILSERKAVLVGILVVLDI